MLRIAVFIICLGIVKVFSQDIIDLRSEAPSLKEDKEKLLFFTQNIKTNGGVIFVINPEDSGALYKYKIFFEKFNDSLLNVKKLLVFHEKTEGSGFIHELFNLKINSVFHYILLNPDEEEGIDNNTSFELLSSQPKAYINKLDLKCTKEDRVKFNMENAVRNITKYYKDKDIPTPPPIPKNDTVYKFFFYSKPDSVFVFSNIGASFFQSQNSIDLLGNQITTIIDPTLTYQLGLGITLFKSKKNTASLKYNLSWQNANVSAKSSLSNGVWKNPNAIDPFGNPYIQNVSVTNFQESIHFSFSQLQTMLVSEIGSKIVRGTFGLGLGFSKFKDISATNISGNWNIEGKYPQINEILSNIPSLGLLSNFNHNGDLNQLPNCSFISIITSLGAMYCLNNKIKCSINLGYSWKVRSTNEESNYYPNQYAYRTMFNPKSFQVNQLTFSCGLVYSLF